MMCVQRLAQSLPSFCTIKRHLWLNNQKFLKQYFFPMLVQKHGTLDPKIQISINFALSLPTFCTMITSSKGYIQKVLLFDLNLISLLWCNQMLVNLNQKSESYIFFIHSDGSSTYLNFQTFVCSLTYPLRFFTIAFFRVHMTNSKSPFEIL